MANDEYEKAFDGLLETYWSLSESAGTGSETSRNHGRVKQEKTPSFENGSFHASLLVLPAFE